MPNGLIVLVGGTIEPGGGMTIRNIGTIVFHGTKVPRGLPPSVPTSGPLNGWLKGAAEWHEADKVPLPELAPMVDADPVTKWVGVDGVPDDDAPTDETARLQSAFDSGGGTIYLHHGKFWISAPIDIPSSVRRVIGMNSSIQVFPKRHVGFEGTTGMFHIKAGRKPLKIESITLDNSDRGQQLGIDDESLRPLVLSDVNGVGVVMLDRKPEGGPVFS